MSASPPKADIRWCDNTFLFVADAKFVANYRPLAIFLDERELGQSTHALMRRGLAWLGERGEGFQSGRRVALLRVYTNARALALTDA